MQITRRHAAALKKKHPTLKLLSSALLGAVFFLGSCALTTPHYTLAINNGRVIDPEDMIDLTDRLQPDGRLKWDAPPGEWNWVEIPDTRSR